MNSLIVEYPTLKGQVSIRTIQEEDKILFSLEDVVLALANENTKFTSTIGRHGLGGLVTATIEVLDSDEVQHIPILEGNENPKRFEVFVTEPGLYRVVTRDTSPAAKKFQRWIFHEVLPSIREHGVYPPPRREQSSELTVLANQLIQNTQLLIREIEERERLERETNERFLQNESAIADLGKKLALAGSKPDASFEINYISIKEGCEQQKININDPQKYRLIWGWAAKLCIEKNRRYIHGDLANIELHKFPKDIIDQAIKESLE